MDLKTNKSAFTLTEILIVLVIAGILLALILPNSLRAVQRGNTVAGDSNVQSCRTALLLCYSENNRDWTAPDCQSVADLQAAQLLRAGPMLNAAGQAIVVTADATTADPNDLTCN